MDENDEPMISTVIGDSLVALTVLVTGAPLLILGLGHDEVTKLVHISRLSGKNHGG